MSLPHVSKDVAAMYAEHAKLDQYESELLKVTIELRNIKARMTLKLREP